MSGALGYQTLGTVQKRIDALARRSGRPSDGQGAGLPTRSPPEFERLSFGRDRHSASGPTLGTREQEQSFTRIGGRLEDLFWMDVSIRMRRSRRESGAESVACPVLLSAALGVFLLLPGLLLIFALTSALGVVPDAGQLWAFGASASAAFVLVAWLLRGPLFAFGWYAGACLFSAWFVAFSYWGIHADWPADLVVLAIPGVRG